MKIVYLDQNKWIDLARASNRMGIDTRLKAALTFVRESSAQGSHVFPLSAIHYLEAAKITDTKRRARLGAAMWELSGGYTLASYGNILNNELETALAKRFPRITPRPFTLLSRGVAHAFGLARDPFHFLEPLRATLPSDLVWLFEGAIQEAMEKSVLTGLGPDGMVMEPFKVSTHNQRFMHHLETLHPRLSELPQAQWGDALHAISLVDIQEPLNSVLQHHGLGWDELAARGREALVQLLADLPSRRIDLHLHRQVLRNPQLKPKITDLEDWGGLGPAAAHCDVLVCERHFASLLLLLCTPVREAVWASTSDLP